MTENINAFDLNGNPRWSFTLSGNDMFLTRELQLVRWQSRPDRPTREAVLTFARRNDTDQLIALNVSDGTELWSCPVDLGEVPQTIAVADGSFAVMSGAQTCGACDPPYAGSSAHFWHFLAPGLSLSDAPWPGTFGGPLHDHLEKAVPVLPPATPN